MGNKNWISLSPEVKGSYVQYLLFTVWYPILKEWQYTSTIG